MPIQFAAPCLACGKPFLHGSGTTCSSCLRQLKVGSAITRKAARLCCDCGNWAVAVILVHVGLREDGITEGRLPLCAQCLEIEKKTQAMLDRLGYDWKR